MCSNTAVTCQHMKIIWSGLKLQEINKFKDPHCLFPWVFFFSQVFEMQGSAFSIHEIQSPEHLNMSQTWLLFAAEESGCLSVVQMRIYAVIPGELAVLGDLGREMGIWRGVCAVLLVVGMSWSNCCRMRQDRLTNTAVKFGNRSRFDTSAWWPTSKWPRLVHVKPVTSACVTWISSWCFAAEGNTWMKTSLGNQSDTVATQPLLLGGCHKLYVPVQGTVAFGDGSLWLIQRLSLAEPVERLWSPVFGGCLWCSSECFLWPLTSNTSQPSVALDWLVKRCLPLLGTRQLRSAEMPELMFSFIQRTTVKTFGEFPPPSSVHEIICICDFFHPVKLQTPVQRRAWRRLRLSVLTDWVHWSFLSLHCWGLVCSRLDIKLNTPVKYKIRCWSWRVFCSFAIIMTCISE